MLGIVTGVQVQKTGQSASSPAKGSRLLLQAPQASVCNGKGAVSSLASLRDAESMSCSSTSAEHGTHSVQFITSSSIPVLTQKNLLIREGSRGSCPMFPHCHTDNRRKQSPLLCLEPPAPLITLPKFNSGSSRCSFNLRHSCCLPFHCASTEQQAQTQSRKFGRAVAGIQQRPGLLESKGSTADSQDKMRRCSKTQRVSIREHSSLFRL